MAGYKYPEVSIVKNVYNVTRMFEADNAGQYDKAQGYTVSNGSTIRNRRYILWQQKLQM